MNTKKILVASLFAVAVVILLFFSYSKIFSTEMPKIADIIPKGPEERCLADFDLKKIDFTDPRFTTNDELGYMLFNSVVMRSFLDNDEGARCDYFNKTGETKVNSLFAPNLCDEKRQTIPMLYNFAKQLKQKLPEETFLNECQAFLLNNSADFKDYVEEKLREKNSKAACQSIYMSYQRGAIVLNDPLFYESDWPTAPTCDCLDAEGKQRVCRNGMCRIMGFFSAVSKNDQSLCPKLTEAVVLPYCNQYFDDQTAKKYEDIFKKSYCKIDNK